MLTKRLQNRCGTVQFRSVAFAPDYQFTFSKRSIDRSGKGNVVLAQGEQVFGVLFDFNEHQLPALDEFEGVGNGYNRDDTFPIELLSGERTSAVTYIADAAHTDHTLRPYDWYLALVLAGAREHSLPAQYLAQLEAIPAIPDPIPSRRTRLEALALL